MAIPSGPACHGRRRRPPMLESGRSDAAAVSISRQAKGSMAFACTGEHTRSTHPVLAYCAVTTCSTAMSALEILREKTHDFDLVLSDVYMPGALPCMRPLLPLNVWSLLLTRPKSGAVRKALQYLYHVQLNFCACCRHGRVQAAGSYRTGTGSACHK